MIPLRVSLVLFALLLAGCVDQDPLGMGVRHVAGPYTLVYSEFGYELIGPAPHGSDPEHGVGRLAGEPFVGFPLAWYGQEDGWIVAGGLSEGWLVIDAPTCGRRGLRTAPEGCHIEGPFAEGPALRRAAELGVTVRPMASAWNRLLPTPGTLLALGAVLLVAVLVLRAAYRRLFAPPRPAVSLPPEQPMRPVPVHPAQAPPARPALPVAVPAPVLLPERPRPGRVRWPVPGLERPLMAAEYGARYGLPADEVVILVQRGVLPGCKYAQRWYAEDMPPPDRLAAIGSREAERRAHRIATSVQGDPFIVPAWSSHVDVIADTAQVFSLSIRPQVGAVAVAFTVFALVLIIVVLQSGEPLALGFTGLWAFIAGRQLWWQTRGWEDVTLTPDRLVIRQHVFSTRTLYDGPPGDVQRFGTRWTSRNDQHTLAVIPWQGPTRRFGRGVYRASRVADLLNQKLRAFTTAHGSAA